MSAHSPIGHSHCCFFSLSNDFVTKKKRWLGCLSASITFDPLMFTFLPLKSMHGPHRHYLEACKHLSILMALHLLFFTNGEKSDSEKLARPRAWQNNWTRQIHGTGEDSGLWISDLLWLWVSRISYKSCMQHGYPHTWSCMQSNVTYRQINAGSVSPQIRKVSNIDGELFSLFNGGSRMSILFIKWNWTLTKTALLVFFTL